MRGAWLWGYWPANILAVFDRPTICRRNRNWQQASDTKHVPRHTGCCAEPDAPGRSQRALPGARGHDGTHGKYSVAVRNTSKIARAYILPFSKNHVNQADFCKKIED